MNKDFKTNSKGITLIALAITIIVLLILAGVSIAAMTSDNGIIKQAQNAKEETEKANMEERIDQIIIEIEGTHRNPTLNDVIEGLIKGEVIGSAQDVNKETGSITTKNPSYIIDGKLDEYLENSGENGKPTDQGTLGTVTGTETTNTVVKDSLGNEVKVPAGFKVINSEETVPDGIIIEDVDASRPTVGSQFVWIPVGEVIKKDNTRINIKLSRYTYNELGEETDEGENKIGERVEQETSTLGNITAKDLKGFRASAINNKGYYIGRYEARTSKQRTSKDDKLTQLTFNSNDYIYNYVTQPQAAELSRNMYNNNYFESDLANSYAWDTAIQYLQAFDNRQNKSKVYSRQESIIKSLANQGTNKLSTQDKICNVYDMASNTIEWITETAWYSGGPCELRGGSYTYDFDYTSYRNNRDPMYSEDFTSFRTIIYL